MGEPKTLPLSLLPALCLPPSLPSSFLLPFSTTVKCFNGNFKSLLASETSVLPLLPGSPWGVCQLHFKKEPLHGGIASGQLWSPLLSSGPALSCWELGGFALRDRGSLWLNTHVGTVIRCCPFLSSIHCNTLPPGRRTQILFCSHFPEPYTERQCDSG